MHTYLVYYSLFFIFGGTIIIFFHEKINHQLSNALFTVLIVLSNGGFVSSFFQVVHLSVHYLKQSRKMKKKREKKVVTWEIINICLSEIILWLRKEKYARSTRFYENMKKMRDKSVASYASSMANACGEFSCFFLRSFWVRKLKNSYVLAAVVTFFFGYWVYMQRISTGNSI